VERGAVGKEPAGFDEGEFGGAAAELALIGREDGARRKERGVRLGEIVGGLGGLRCYAFASGECRHGRVSGAAECRWNEAYQFLDLVHRASSMQPVIRNLHAWVGCVRL
jgi:hypothetical protein